MPCLHCELDSSFTHSFSVYTSSAVQSCGHTSVTREKQQDLLKRCFLSVTFFFFPARWRCNDGGHGQIFGPPGPAGAGGRLAPSGGLHGLQRWCAVTEVRHTPVNNQYKDWNEKIVSYLWRIGLHVRCVKARSHQHLKWQNLATRVKLFVWTLSNRFASSTYSKPSWQFWYLSERRGRSVQNAGGCCSFLAVLHHQLLTSVGV